MSDNYQTPSTVTTNQVAAVASQSQPVRALNTVYHNATSKPIYCSVVGVIAATGGFIAAYTDNQAAPTLLVAAFTADVVVTSFQATVLFIVLPGNYYKVYPGTITLAYWTEWT